MAYKYGDKRTNLNGIFNHVFNAYPKAKEILDFYKKIPLDQRHCRWNSDGFEKFIKDYITSIGETPSRKSYENAHIIQNDFKSFIKYCQANLK